MPKLSVIVPCLNEAASLSSFIAKMRDVLEHADIAPAELIFIDDGSTDDTWMKIEAICQKLPNARACRHDSRKGITAAWRTGVAAARADWVCVIDADLQYDPAEIPRLWRARETSGADLVQGARANEGRPRDVRFLLSRGLCNLLNLVFGMSLLDNKSGFFLCTRDAFAALLDHHGRYRHWQCFVMVAAHHHGLAIHQIETPFRPRVGGSSAFGRFAIGPTLGVIGDLATALGEYGTVGK